MPSAAEQLAANFNFSNFGKAKELRDRLLFTLGMLIVARLGTYIPMPGIDPAAIAEQIHQQQGGLLEVFNVLAGGEGPARGALLPRVVAYLLRSRSYHLRSLAIPR